VSSSVTLLLHCYVGTDSRYCLIFYSSMNNERITAITDINYNEITTTTGCNREWHSWEWDGNKSYTCGNKMEVGEKM